MAPTTTEVATIKIDGFPLDSAAASWIFDPVTNKFSLTVNMNGINIPALNGFYTLQSIETQTVNEVQTQVVVNSTYYFNEAGEMITGWVKTADNKTYFFENAKTTKEGEMIVGWKQIQNTWYYFNTDGSLLTNGTTPDGYIVGADGAML